VACHLGVLTDLPCVGVAKNLLHVDGLVKDELHKEQVKPGWEFFHSLIALENRDSHNYVLPHLVLSDLECFYAPDSFPAEERRYFPSDRHFGGCPWYGKPQGVSCLFGHHIF